MRMETGHIEWLTFILALNVQWNSQTCELFEHTNNSLYHSEDI